MSQKHTKYQLSKKYTFGKFKIITALSLSIIYCLCFAQNNIKERLNNLFVSS